MLDMRTSKTAVGVLAGITLALACGTDSATNFSFPKRHIDVDASTGGAIGSSGSSGGNIGGDETGGDETGGETPGGGGGPTGSGGETSSSGGTMAAGGGGATSTTASGGSPGAQGGVAVDGGDADGGTPPSQTSCRMNSDCAAAPGRPLCDAKKSQCIACHTNAQCAAAQECVESECKPLSACKSSLDCASRMDGKTICDSTNRVCVQCTAAADCGAGRVCANRVCRTSCSSDNDCSALHMVCNKGLSFGGQCTACTSGECPRGKYCEAGACVPLTCNPAQQSCAQNVVVQCNDSGSDVVPQKQCTLMPLVPACLVKGDNADCVGTCYDERRDALEADIDCGGPLCTRCSKGKTCAANNDCASNKCTSSRCE